MGTRSQVVSLVLSVLGEVCNPCEYSLTDALQGTRFEPVEVQNQMRVLLDRGHAQLRVERVIFNPGSKPDQAVYSFGVPDGAVATSLKTLGTLNGQPHWFYGDLREAEEAAKAYQELTGIGGYYPKDPALMSWHSATNLLLQVFPCMPKQEKAVGYTLDLPMGYEAGRYRVTLPSMGVENKPARFTVETVHAGDRVFINDKPLDAGRILALNEEQHLALEPYRVTGVTGELAVADTGLGRTFAHVRFALAKQLSKIPNDAYVVLAIDNSRSMGSERATAVTMAEGTLKLFSNAQVQILDFDRKPRPRFASFVPVRTALGALRRELSHTQIPEAGNGSEVDLALVESERLLSNVPSSKAKRILLFTDSLVPERITDADVAASVGRAGAILHIINVSGSVPESFERDDQHPWASAARITGGLVWQPSSTPNDELADGIAAAGRNPYLPFVRPTTLYNAVYSFPLDPDPEKELGNIEEGSGVERQGLYIGEARWVRLSGELWSQPFRLTVHPDANAGKLWSALVFGTDQLNELSEAEMMVLAKRGGAVSPVTSYLAIEPGVRPSTEGLDWDEIGGAFGDGGLGLSGIGEGGGGRGEGIGFGLDPFDPQAFLEKRLRAKWAECKGEAGNGTVSLETHYVEVADVTLQVDTDPEKYGCIQEAAWSLDLRTGRFEDRRKNWEIRL